MFLEETPIAIDICGNTKYKSQFIFSEFCKVNNSALLYSAKDISEIENLKNIAIWVATKNNLQLLPNCFIEEIFLDSSTPYLSEVIQTELYSVAKYSFKFTIIYTEEVN